MLVVHGVECHHSLHVRGREFEYSRDLHHSFFTNPTALALHDPQRRKKRRHLRRIALEQLVELLLYVAGENSDVRPLSATIVGCVIGGLRTADKLGRRRQRSISPMTMSMLAL